MNPETKIEQDAVDLIWEHLGIKGSKLKILGENAFPDRIFWLPGGQPFLIEFKVPGENARPLQVHNHDELRRLGYHVEVHDNAIDAFEAVITKLEATQLPKASHQVLARARRQCTLFRSRTR
jgi:hypothetical protein